MLKSNGCEFYRSELREQRKYGELGKMFHGKIGIKLICNLMHALFLRASGLTETIIAAAIEVHREKGPGLIESIYEWCLLKELGLRSLQCLNQKCVIIEYKGFTREETLRFDVLVEGCVLIEVKAVERILPIHKAQLLSYMKLLNVPIGLLINFYELRVTEGINRLILPGANLPGAESSC